MKNAIVICLIVLLAVGGGFVIYGAISDARIESVSIAATDVTGQIGSFSALSPKNGDPINSAPVFSWETAENAETYTLEISSSDEFDVADEYYIIKTGLVSTSYHLLAELKKDKRYYWRVTAKNAKNSLVIDGDCLNFYYEATLLNEIPISIGYADEWKVHEVGSKATVSLDHSSFFAEKGNAVDMAAKKDSLRISFDSEDTQRGEKYVESNGWVVVTRSLETEFYGTDAFYFNFYYAGNDATAYFRLIDEDNEYWYAPIKLAVNAKQTIIMRLEDFVLRTKGTPVMNEKFDYHYLKSMEIVFERVDGDGVAYFSDLRAIRLDNYGDRFVENFDFNDITTSDTLDPVVVAAEEEKWLNEKKDYFFFRKTIENEGSSLKISFKKNDSVDSENKPGEESKKGYGFVKLPINRILRTSDAFSFHVDLSGIATKNFNYLLRVIEEDDDVWVFKIAAGDIPTDGNLLVPYAAFTLSEFKGDGIRQFYFVKQIQFGLNSCYQGGAIKISDFKIVSLVDEVEDLYKTTVDENGLIENFESYFSAIDVYYKWETSTANKDEAIDLYVDSTIGAKNHAAKMYYKTDLPEAEYKITFDSVDGYTAIELLAKDVSDGTYKATMTVYLYGGPSELYSYEIKRLDKEWTRYTIPISKFDLTENSFGSQHISCENITGISLAFKYSNFVPGYYSGSYVAVDTIRFAQGTEYAKKAVSGKIKQSTTNPMMAMISDFDSDDTFVYWDVKQDVFGPSDMASNSAATIDDDVTASGTGRSLCLAYKTQMAAPYYADFVVDSSVKANGLTLLLKGDGRAPYVEVIVYVNNKAYKKRIDVQDGWNYYSIGFSQFKFNNTEEGIDAQDVSKINSIAMYIKNYSGNYIPSNIYMDEIYFDRSITVSTNSVRAYE